MLTITRKIGEGIRVGDMGSVTILGHYLRTVNMDILGEQRLVQLNRTEHISRCGKNLTVSVKKHKGQFRVTVGAPPDVSLTRSELCIQ